MSESVGSSPLRAMTTGDVPAVLAVQEPGAVVGLAQVFPQDTYPFPRGEVARRWREEIASRDVDCFVVAGDTVLAVDTVLAGDTFVADGTVVGFAAIRGDEFLHFGDRPRALG